MYSVYVNRIWTTEDGWDTSTSTPTFFLDVSTQMIVDRDHARRIAESIVRAIAGDDLSNFHIIVNGPL